MDDRQKVFVWILLCWCSLVCNLLQAVLRTEVSRFTWNLVDSEIPMIPPKKQNHMEGSLFAAWGINTSFIFAPQGDLRFSRRAFGDAHRVPWVENDVVGELFLLLPWECRGFSKITGLFCAVWVGLVFFSSSGLWGKFQSYPPEIYMKRFIRFIKQASCLRCGFLSVPFCWVAVGVSFDGSFGENPRPDLASQARVVKLLRHRMAERMDVGRMFSYCVFFWNALKAKDQPTTPPQKKNKQKKCHSAFKKMDRPASRKMKELNFPVKK